MSMKCTVCGSTSTMVIDSRPNELGDAVRRRRKCASCGHRFSTYEVNSEVFADAVESSERVAKLREATIEQFAALLPAPPTTNPMRLRPRRNV